ncbi:MAG: Wzz/FepE/Etk N-terminal domain-containing protein [Ferruginibacter sp.]
MDLLYFLRILYRRKWLIIALSGLAAIAAFAFLFNKKPVFESLAQYSTGFTAEKVRLTDGTTEADLNGAEVKFNNVIETFKSPQVVGMISYKLMLHDLQHPENAYHKLTVKETGSSFYRSMNRDSLILKLQKKVTKNELLSSDNEDDRKTLEYLKFYQYDYFNLLKNLVISRVERTDYLDILYSSEHPELSATVVNAMGDEFLNYYRTLNGRRAEENATRIKDAMDAQQNKVDTLNQKLIAEKTRQGTVDATSAATSAMETVKSLESSLAEEKSKYNEHFNRIAYLKDKLNTLQAGGTTVTTTNNDEVIRLTNKKNDLVAELARKGNNDAALLQQINDIRSEIILKSKSGSSVAKATENIDAVKNSINEETALMNAASTTIDQYNASIRKYTGITNSNPGSDIKIGILQNTSDMESKQLANLKDKYSQVQGLMRDDPTSNFIQTRVGQPAVEPESKKIFVKMALAGISVFFLAAVFFIFVEIFDSSVKTPAIFSKQSKLKIANILNKVDLKKTPVTEMVVQDNEGKKFLQQAVFKNNIRKLRYELLNSGKQVFLFTSTQKKSGKTTSIEALATSLLLSKKKVLIIDLNFTNNSLTQNLNADVFIQDLTNINYNAPLTKITGSTLYDDLKIIGCREGNITPSEALYNVDMAALLEGFKKEFDFILIEGASLNYYADSKELIQYAQGVFTVFAADASISQVDTDSMKFIADLREKNHGVILNKVFTENINS